MTGQHLATPERVPDTISTVLTEEINMATQPRWNEVYDDLVSRIGPGKQFPPGAQLPSRTQICRMYVVSEWIADRVQDRLKAAGWSVTVHGKGIFVRDPLPEHLLDR